MGKIKIIENSIRTRLRGAFIVLAICPLLLLCLVLAWQSYTIQIKQAFQQQHEISARAQERILDFFHAIQDESAMVMKVNDLLGVNPATRHSILSKLRSYNNSEFDYHDVYEELILADRQGKETARVSRTRVFKEADYRDISGAEAFRLPMRDGKVYYSPVSFHKNTGEPSITIGMPLVDIRSASPEGVLIAEIRLKNIWYLVANLRIGEAGDAFLLDDAGKVIAHKNPSLVLRGTHFPVTAGTTIRTGLTGAKALIDSEEIRLGTQKLYLVTERPVGEALNLTFRILIIIGSLLVIALAGAVTLGLVVTRRIIAPIESLADTARAIGEGDLSRRAEPTADDEIGLLAGTFNTMAAQLIETIDSIRNEKVKTEAIIAGIGDPLSIMDTEFKILYQNQPHKDLMGEHAGEVCHRAYEHRDEVCENCPVAEAFQDGRMHKAERTGITGKGVVYIDVTASPIRDATGRIIAGVEIGKDISARKLVEKELAAGKERLAVTLASIGDAVIATDTAGLVILMNKIAEDLTGWSQQEAAGKPLPEVFFIIDEKTRARCRNPVEEVLLSGMTTAIPTHTVLISRNGAERVISDSGAPIRDENNEIMGTVIVFRDITERRRIEEELFNAKKLEAVGVLSAGIAHEINNPLANASLKLEILKQMLTKSASGEEILAKLQAVERNVDRASTIAKELLDFSRQREFEFMPVNMNSLLSGTLLLMQHRLNHVTVGRNFAETADINGDPVKLEQVFINILTNAAEATPAGGSIDISTSQSGNFIKITVTDTGKGISKRDLSKVFDPFFTTKEVGAGTGLGLSICYGIVTQHRGGIEISSAEGEGTIVTVKLPLKNDAVEGD